MTLRIGSLCSGYGGLDAAMSQVLGGEVGWVSDVDPGACATLEHRFPAIPNAGDLTRLDWASLGPVDVIGGGIPCQPFSAAGKRKGTADERHLWPYMAAGIAVLRPALAVIENVQGLVSRGLIVVLADLAAMGYDAAWTVVGASDAGAPHRRKRLFVLAVRDGLDPVPGLPVAVLGDARWVTPGSGLFGPVPFAGRIPDHGIMTAGQIHPRPAPLAGPAGLRLPTPAAHDSGNTPENHLGKKPGRQQVTSLQVIAEHGLLETGGQLPTPQAADSRRGTDVQLGGDRPSGAKRSDGLATAMLRTPTAQLAINGGSQHPDKRIAGGHGPTLADEIEHLSTPRASDGGAGRGSSAGWGLRNEARKITASLPTPCAADGDRTSATWGRGNPTLTGAVLPTPAARDFRSGKSNIMDRNARPLNEVIEHLPTPNAKLAEDSQTHRSGARSGELLLTGIAQELGRNLPTPQASDWKGSGAAQGRDRDGRPRTAGDADLPEAVDLLPSPRASGAAEDDGDLEAVVISIAGRRRKDGAGHGQLIMPGTTLAPPPRLALLSPTAEAWGKYAPGIARWETVLGRYAPPPTQPGRDGKPRLSPLAVEFMMGLAAGWVCDVPGLSRSQMLKLLGNGVVPLQGALGLALLADLVPARIWAALAEAA